MRATGCYMMPAINLSGFFWVWVCVCVCVFSVLCFIMVLGLESTLLVVHFFSSFVCWVGGWEAVGLGGGGGSCFLMVELSCWCCLFGADGRSRGWVGGKKIKYIYVYCTSLSLSLSLSLYIYIYIYIYASCEVHLHMVVTKGTALMTGKASKAVK